MSVTTSVYAAFTTNDGSTLTCAWADSPFLQYPRGALAAWHFRSTLTVTFGQAHVGIITTAAASPCCVITVF
jgi:hypothetical protein